MKTINRTLSFLWHIWVTFLFIVFTFFIGVFFTYPLTLKRSTYPIAYKFVRLWAYIIFYGSGLFLIYNSKPIDFKKNYIVVSNHTSVMDILVMIILLKGPSVFVGKKELEKIPIFGMIYKRLAITVDRSDARSRTAVMRQAAERIKDNVNIIIFPEGGVPDDESIVLDDFKMGPFALAVSYELPMLIFGIKGLKKRFPFSWFRGSPGTVDAELLDIVPANTYTKKSLKSFNRDVYKVIYAYLTT